MLRFLIIFLAFSFAFAFDDISHSQEVSEDGIPVIVKHLPNWEAVKDSAILIKTKEKLIAVLGERPIFEAFEFVGGAEAVTADYPAGRLLIVEYNTPQLSIDADEKIKAKFAELSEESILYRRIGNYNVFVFDVKDKDEASALLDKVKYEKVVQWLSDDPFQSEKTQRAYGIFIGKMLLSTILAIFLGIGTSALIGICVGLIMFYAREKERQTWEKFSDAGGMIRLNLDELQEVPKKLLRG